MTGPDFVDPENKYRGSLVLLLTGLTQALQRDEYAENIKNPPDGKKIYGIFMDGYQNTQETYPTDRNPRGTVIANCFAHDLTMDRLIGNNQGASGPLNNNVTLENTKEINEDYNLEHGGSYYEWTDHAEGDHRL